MHRERIDFMKRDELTVLRSPFDVKVHKETFINYIEVVILEDGSIEYAVPSHQMKVVDIIANKRNITRQDVADLCPPEYYFNYNYWLCIESNTIMVWNDFYMGNPNNAQLQTLIMLMTEGLYQGERIEWEK